MPVCPSGGERAWAEGGEEKSSLNSISAMRWKEFSDCRFVPLNLQKRLRPCSWELGTVALVLSFVKGLDYPTFLSKRKWDCRDWFSCLQVSEDFCWFWRGLVLVWIFFLSCCFAFGIRRVSPDRTWMKLLGGYWITCPRAASPCSRGWVPNHVRLPGITPASSLSPCASLSSVHLASELPHH